jgi:hypothetical protein
MFAKFFKYRIEESINFSREYVTYKKKRKEEIFYLISFLYEIERLTKKSKKKYFNLLISLYFV